MRQEQPRAYTTGTVEFINDEWIFFDEETDEAFLLEDIAHVHIEVLKNGWLKGELKEKGRVILAKSIYRLQNGDMVRIQKALLHSYDCWLEQLDDSTFYQFISSLNQLGYSMYDCIYCHNQLLYSQTPKTGRGVNFLIFDNEESICSMHHHYNFNESPPIIRFEFTESHGHRMLRTIYNWNDDGIEDSG
ncbi:DUF2777 family protein [Bacillus sp. HMF5848]|nr:DUF2777 family protein [Bacillus sp. HMF5848]